MRVVATALMTLDGLIDNPHLWSFDYMDEGTEGRNRGQLFDADALLLGRETYVGFAEAWPTMTDEAGFAERMNSITTYVVSTTLEKAEWNNATIISENVVERVAELRKQPGRDLLIYGVGRLARELIAHGLLDEVRLSMHPVVTGAETNTRVFDRGDQAKLELVSATTHSTGVIDLVYRPLSAKAD
ncbi:dihydrofolate reductase family protein [Allonocardiopsis opalescens]|uniref:Dihydrofolate reductase n=1 Tax=Allonocardiopsis opalescens TaxID=1144618 RepID=A0A2T0PSF4_9ACTN|nr:dihydrofolate reductase family protein [Allonocardiopsis opalescens]PRX91830.1 dihydrofolate reductase [Allonocardiopsis opalescens]